MKTEKFETICVGKEAKISKQNEPYGVISIMDGANVLNLVTKDQNLFNEIKSMKPYVVQLDVSIGKYTKVDIVSMVAK